MIFNILSPNRSIVENMNPRPIGNNSTLEEIIDYNIINLLYEQRSFRGSL